MTIFDTILGGL